MFPRNAGGKRTSHARSRRVCRLRPRRAGRRPHAISRARTCRAPRSSGWAPKVRRTSMRSLSPPARRPQPVRRPNSCRRPRASGRRRAGGRRADGRASGRGRAADRRPTSRPRSGSTSRLPPAITADRRLLRVPLQPGAGQVRRAEAQADAQEPLPSFRLDDVTLTFNVDADYEIVRTQLTQNVVGDRRGHAIRS